MATVVPLWLHPGHFSNPIVLLHFIQSHVNPLFYCMSSIPTNQAGPWDPSGTDESTCGQIAHRFIKKIMLWLSCGAAREPSEIEPETRLAVVNATTKICS